MKTMVIYKIDEGTKNMPEPKKYIELKYTDSKYPPLFSDENVE